MSTASALQENDIGCFENPDAATATGRLELQPPGSRHSFAITNVPSQGSLVWKALLPKPSIAGVEGFYFVIASSEKPKADTADDEWADETSLFLRSACFLDATGHKRDAADYAIDKLDDLLNAGEFQRCNRILCTATPKDMSELLIVTFLGITLGAKDRLTSRSLFYSRSLAAVADRRGALGADQLLSKYR